MLSVNISVDGIEQTNELLQSINDFFNNMENTFQDLGQSLIDFFETEVWESEGGAFGESWAPLTEGTMLQKEKLYPGRGILERTGTLRYGFEMLTSSQYLVVQNPVPYAVYHQEGTEKMPQRVIMKIDEQRLVMIGDKIASDLKDHLGGNI